MTVGVLFIVLLFLFLASLPNPRIWTHCSVASRYPVFSLAFSFSRRGVFVLMGEVKSGLENIRYPAFGGGSIGIATYGPRMVLYTHIYINGKREG